MSILLTAQAVLASSPATTLLSHEEYSNIRDVSERIISQYPPDQYIYVGVGRSPTPFLAYLETRLGESAVMHLPLGKLGLFAPGKSYYNEQNKSALDSYLDGYIQKGISQNKKLLFFDFVFSGESLINLKRELSRNPNFNNIKILAIKNIHGVARYTTLFRENNISYLEMPAAIEKKLIDGGYDRFSKYESLPLIDTANQRLSHLKPVLNPERYYELAAAMKSCSQLFY